MSGHGHRPAGFTAAELSIPAGHAWNRLPLFGAVAGLVLLAAAAGLGLRDPRQFYFSWLVAFAFWLSIALGGLFFVLTHYVTKAHWSVVLCRTAENVMAPLPLFALLFLPLLPGLAQLYHWMDPHAAHDPLLQGKAPYLNRDFFLLRAAIYFLAWTALARWFLRRSTKQDETGDPATTLALIRFSGPAILVFAVTVSLAAIDWLMSLDPHWYSTIFGVYYFAGCLVGFFATLCLLALALERTGLLRGTVTVEHFHDLGKLLFAFTVFWAYIGFSQYLLIWYANIPEETSFFLDRSAGSWRAVTALLAWGHFGVPFLFLMSRNVKRRRGLLAAGAAWMLLMHFADLHWLVMPVLHEAGAAPSLLDLLTLLGVGSLFLGAVLRTMRRRALIPVRDPRLADSLGFENA